MSSRLNPDGRTGPRGQKRSKSKSSHSRSGSKSGAKP